MLHKLNFLLLIKQANKKVYVCAYDANMMYVREREIPIRKTLDLIIMIIIRTTIRINLEITTAATMYNDDNNKISLFNNDYYI